VSSEPTMRSWLRAEVSGLLKRKTSPLPLVLWCDPENAWRDLLRAAAEGGAFELWSEGEHELLLRERLMTSPPAPRVVWLPVARDEITYLKVFELQAEHVWEEPLVAALARFGVEIPRDHELELRQILPAHVKEWIDRPRPGWRELTPGSAKSALVGDDLILAALAKPGTPIAEIIGEDRTGVFVRRVAEDFGFPPPEPGKDDEWRVAATARLLATEAAVRVPADPPNEADRIIVSGQSRDNALKLLERWQKDVELMSAFEELARKADATTSLVYWARNITGTVPALASRVCEETLFRAETEALARIEEFDPLAKRLEEREAFYTAHSRGFWGNRAENRVPWNSLVSLGRAAALLRRQLDTEKQWTAPSDAVTGFTTTGWEADRQGEILFSGDAELPAALHGVRARLRRAYLRHLDRSNAAFSELLAHSGIDSLGLPFAGEVLASRSSDKEATAVLVLDACRYDLGARLAEALNKGEPARRAEVIPARAPLPSITPLGIAFALAAESGKLCVELTREVPARWKVTETGAGQELSTFDGRREWLKQRFKLKPLSIAEDKALLDSVPPGPKETGRVLFVFGGELDAQGHEGELKFTGAGDYIERYVRLIRRLRDAGYSTVVVVTDHGYIHWDPEKDEVEDSPVGDVLWKSRRAVVGRGLKHPTALAVAVPGSDLECRVPRSVNAFRAYGGIGYFHGGATLQELVIPVVICRWPKKAEKIPVVLTPITEIKSVKPWIEVRPGSTGRLPGMGAEAQMTGRTAVVKIVEPGSGRRLFRSTASLRIEPDGSPVTFKLETEPGETCHRGARLQVEVRDADNDELLDRCDAELKVDLEEWD